MTTTLKKTDAHLSFTSPAPTSIGRSADDIRGGPLLADATGIGVCETFVLDAEKRARRLHRDMVRDPLEALRNYTIRTARCVVVH